VSRRLKTDIPGRDFRLDPIRVREEGLAAAYLDLPRPHRLVVEIGFGRGEFLQELAKAELASAFLGIEYSRKRVLKFARRLARGELANVRLLCISAEVALRDLLLPASVAACWINFPDPWPKKRHHRRRLIQPEITARIASCLVPGGELHVATDHPGYAEAIAECLSGESQLENAFAPDAHRAEVPGRTPTAYELEWRALGRPLFFFEYRRSSDRRVTGSGSCAGATPASEAAT
jgi:tRNA (guanine-N7-)-methyltransferase